MTIHDLPAINATLNGLSAVFLTLGYICIKSKKITLHKICMMSAFCTSVVFLGCYLFYHYHAGRTKFEKPEWFRPIYITLLLSHTILAVVIVPMILMTLNRAFKQRYELHKHIARLTLPLWMYVSVTGVLVYWILYVKFPQHAH